MCADPQVMRYFPAPMTRLEAAALIGRIRGHFNEYGFGLWALERKDSGAFIGMTGLLNVNFDAPFAPAVEIGWRLARRHWGLGFASEAAWTCLRCAFAQLRVDEVVSFTSESNLPSQKSCRPSAWSGRQWQLRPPRLPIGHPLRPHVLYRMDRAHWEQTLRTE